MKQNLESQYIYAEWKNLELCCVILLMENSNSCIAKESCQYWPVDGNGKRNQLQMEGRELRHDRIVCFSKYGDNKVIKI